MNSRRPDPKNAANKALDALTSPGHRTRYFDGVPITEMIEICESAGFVISEDDRSMILCGREGKATVDLYQDGKTKNTLVFTWYKMEATGRYEVVAYVS